MSTNTRDSVREQRQLLGLLPRLFDFSIFLFVFWGFTPILLDAVKQRAIGRGLLRLLILTVLSPVIWHLCHIAAGVYRSHRISSLRGLMFEAAVALISSFAVLWLLFRLVGITWPTGPALNAMGRGLLLSCGGRAILQFLLIWIRRRGCNLRRVLIVGTNTRAIAVADRLHERPELGMRVVGFADDTWEGTRGFVASEHHLVCNLDSLPHVLRSQVIDEVFLWLPVRTYYDRISEIAAYCGKLGIITRFPGHLIELQALRTYVDSIDGHMMLTLAHTRLEGIGAITKMILDRVLAAAALIVLSPLLVTIAIAVKISSPGPVLFKQARVGLHRRTFFMLKFRTMVTDAEARLGEVEALNEVEGAAFKMVSDPRVTALGRWLRKFSLDELPQFFNVLLGEMSLVGPRPLPLRDYDHMRKDWQLRRLSVQPGLSCLWQVSGRHQLSFERWMELDMAYIDQWSLWLDLKILARTVVTVVRGEGAW